MELIIQEEISETVGLYNRSMTFKVEQLTVTFIFPPLRGASQDIRPKHLRTEMLCYLDTPLPVAFQLLETRPRYRYFTSFSKSRFPFLTVPRYRDLPFSIYYSLIETLCYFYTTLEP